MKKWQELVIVIAVIVGIGVNLAAHNSNRTTVSVPQVAVEAVKPYEPPVLDLNILWQPVNDERTKVGLQPLVRDQRLDAAAQAKCDDMVAKDYWSHDAPDGTEPWHFIDEAGVKYRSAGENLASNINNAEVLATTWMNSPAHKSNILDSNFTNVGYAQCHYESNSKNGVSKLTVQMFTLPQ